MKSAGLLSAPTTSTTALAERLLIMPAKTSASAGPESLWTYRDISIETGIPAATLRVWYSRGKLPQPDFILGALRSPAWRSPSLLPWLEEHRGWTPTGWQSQGGGAAE